MTQKLLMALACATALATPAWAQDMGDMPMDHNHRDHGSPQAQPMDHGQMDHGQMNNDTPQDPSVDHDQMDHSGHAGMDMSGMHGPSDKPTEGSGTALLPANEGGMKGLHTMAGDWMLMAHGTASAQYTDHTGPRGDDKAYVTTMAMLMAQRETDWGRLQFRSMFSLEPAMKAKGYPNLFATGETAGGEPLVDRQHPHDLFMELAARVDFNIGQDTRLFLYGGPVGEPALGPSAFVHRGSAQYNPEPPITHHWFDSTHITYGVATTGLAGKIWQLEASAFRGREPDERRWNIEKPKLDSWSVRGTLTPSPAWAIQASYGEIKSPESTHPDENEHRFTASAHYANGRGLNAMLAFSAKNRVPGPTLTAWLAEANWNIDDRNTVFGRVENVANDELFPDHDHPLHDRTFRVSKFQIGYARRIPLGPVEMALGGSIATYAKPGALDAAYDKHPMGYTVFARFTLGD